ncbi:MAG: type II toxin-antitoxin system HicA family toxin [Pseudonocardiaceae bacterium]
MSKPPSLKYSEASRRLRELGAYLARHGGEHEIWRCECGQHQTALPRHTVSPYVVGKIGKQMPCLGKEWWR